MTTQTLDLITTALGDQQWRLANLYKIKDKEGRVVDFQPNWAQQSLFHPHYLNIILKARACAPPRNGGGTSLSLTIRGHNIPCVAFSGHLSLQ